MRRLITILILILIAGYAYAGTTTTNGYFYTHSIGDSGTTARSTETTTKEATDGVIQLNVAHRSGASQAHTNLVNTGFLEVGGATGIRASGALGIGKLGGVGQTNNEGITIDFETNEDVIEVTSHTGASSLRVTGMGFRPSRVTADPCGGTSGTYESGAIFYNHTSNYMCFCDGVNADIKMNDNSTACF